MSSLYKRESFPMPFVEEADSVSIQRAEWQWRQTPSLCNVEIVFSTHRRECPSAICRGGRHVLYTENRMPSIHRGESVPPLSLYKGESVFSTRRRECPSAICRGGWQLRHSGVENLHLNGSGQ